MSRGLKILPWEDRQFIEAFSMKNSKNLFIFAAGSVVDCLGYMDRNAVDPKAS